MALLLPLALAAYQYETVLLETQAKLVPRFLRMSTGVMNNVEGRLAICVVYDEGEAEVADAFAGMVRSAYPDGWKGERIWIVKSRYGSLERRCARSELLFLLNAEEPKVWRAVSFATAKRKLTVSYENRYLEEGVLVSLHVGRSVRPYLNLSQAKAAGIHFSSGLKRISKFLEPPRGRQ
ncbi:YfiR/HmsC family protein [Sulfurimonas sp. ST-25]|uniref:YfiR/HmsC family protein n=1 Tax=Sulfurimonas sp. ST-25 TaxID=3400151 RepID=UPI003A83CD3B